MKKAIEIEERAKFLSEIEVEGMPESDFVEKMKKVEPPFEYEVDEPTDLRPDRETKEQCHLEDGSLYKG